MNAELLNPTLYVLVGSVKDTQITTEAEKTHPAGAMICLCISSIADIDNCIRSGKAELQESSNLSVQRANIYVIAKAHEPGARELTQKIGDSLRKLFAEDFAAFHITLAVFVNESNELDQEGIPYNTRCKATYEFLAPLTGVTTFDIIYLLSDRNENGRVSEENRQNACKFMAHLPYLHYIRSDFDKLMARRAVEAGRVLYASGGIGVGLEDEATPTNNGFYTNSSFNKYRNSYLHILAQVLENELAESTATSYDSPINEHETTSLEKEIKDDLVSVAAKPISFLELTNMSVKEAEQLLFGDNAMRFFERTYSIKPKTSKNASNLPLKKAAIEEKYLKNMASYLLAQISRITQELAKKEETRLGFFNSVDDAKDAIGECYALKYKLNNLQAKYTAAVARQAMLKDYLEYIRNIISTLKSFTVKTPSEETPEQLLAEAEKRATLNISLLRDDGLIHEKHILGTPQNPYVLRLIGGFVLEDLTRYNTIRELSTATTLSCTGVV